MTGPSEAVGASRLRAVILYGTVLLTLAACGEPVTSAGVPQDSVVIAVPSIALAVELTPATIAVGDTTTIRVTVTNRSTTPVTIDLTCAAIVGYRIETLAGEPAPGVSRPVCPGAIVPTRFGPREVRVVELRLPRLGGERTAVEPGEYQVRATLGGILSAPVRLIVTPAG